VIFTKLEVGEGVSGPLPGAKFHYSGFRNVGLFCYKSAPKGQIPLWIFKIQNLASERVLGSNPQAKFHRCGFKNVDLHPPKSPKLVIFCIKFVQSDFYKIWRGVASPRSPQLRQLLPLSR